MSDQLNSCAISESCVKRELRWDKVDFFFIIFYQLFFLLHYTFMSFLPQCKIQTTVIAFVTEIASPTPLTRAINHFSYHSSYPNHTKNSIISFLICKTQYTQSLQPPGQQPTEVPKCQATELSSQWLMSSIHPQVPFGCHLFSSLCSLQLNAEFNLRAAFGCVGNCMINDLFFWWFALITLLR